MVQSVLDQAEALVNVALQQDVSDDGDKKTHSAHLWLLLGRNYLLYISVSSRYDEHARDNLAGCDGYHVFVIEGLLETILLVRINHVPLASAILTFWMYLVGQVWRSDSTGFCLG